MAYKRIQFPLLLLILLGCFWQLQYGSSTVIGIMLAIGYLSLVGRWWQMIFSRALGWRKDWTTFLLGSGMTIVLSGLFSSIFVVWYRITAIELTLSLLLTAGSTYVFLLSSNKNAGRVGVLVSEAPNIERNTLLRMPRIALLMYLVLWGITLRLMEQSQSTAVLHTPWQTLDPRILPLFFAASMVLGLLLFSRIRTNVILLFVLLHSFLLHAYLPLSHALPWGGDVWRMIAVEEKLSEGQRQLPVLFGEGADVSVLLKPHKYVYGQLWGLSILSKKIFATNFIEVNRWLVPILWSTLIPLLFYRCGRLFFRSPRYGLWLAALSLLPFTYQALGGLTLATSLGFITFCFALLWWFSYLSSKKRSARNIAILISTLMLFGYPVYFFLMWFTIVVGTIMGSIKHVQRKIRVALVTVITFCSFFFFPLIEITSGVSTIQFHVDVLEQSKQLVGEASGWFFARGIRPQDILPWNVFFNHTPQIAFVPSLFTDIRWPLVAGMFALLMLVLYGLCHFRGRERHVLWHMFFFLFLTVISGYIMGWHVLEGDRSFTRRLDPLVAWTLLIAALYGIAAFFSSWRVALGRVSRTVLLLLFIIAVSWGATSVYASGPDIRSLSTEEYAVAAFVWSGDSKPVCVLGDTWFLLALEAVSKTELIGGGFPLGHQFAQAERVSLLEEVSLSPTTSTIERIDAFAPEGKRCMIVLGARQFDPSQKEAMDRLVGVEAVESSGHIIWQPKDK